MPEFVQGLLVGIAITAIGVALILWLIREPRKPR